MKHHHPKNKRERMQLAARKKHIVKYPKDGRRATEEKEAEDDIREEVR